MKNKNKKKQSPKLGMTVPLVVIGAILFLILYFKKPEKVVVKALPTVGVPSQYSDAEIHNLWTNKLQSVLTEELFVGKYHLPEIQHRWDLLYKRIADKYHTNLTIALSKDYIAESKNIRGGSSLREGIPNLGIIVPAFVDIYKALEKKNEPGWEATVRYSLVVLIMHELDHLSRSDLSWTREHPQPLDVLIQDETEIWALTTEHTIKPMIEVHRLPLTSNEQETYRKWIEAGRDEKNPVWTNFIYNAYKDVRR